MKVFYLFYVKRLKPTRHIELLYNVILFPPSYRCINKDETKLAMA